MKKRREISAIDLIHRGFLVRLSPPKCRVKKKVHGFARILSRRTGESELWRVTGGESGTEDNDSEERNGPGNQAEFAAKGVRSVLVGPRPRIEGPFAADDRPRMELSDGDKLHAFAGGATIRVGGFRPPIDTGFSLKKEMMHDQVRLEELPIQSPKTRKTTAPRTA